jgi:hypothetical protein
MSDEPVADKLDEIDLDNAEVVDSKYDDITGNDTDSLSEEKRPDMSDIGWTDYVLRQLEENEKFSGRPTCNGLRRITPLLLGAIIKSVPIIAQCPHPDNDSRAVIGWELAIRWDDDPNDIRIFGDVADVYTGNTVPEYAVYASATCATRAEGRALRKALGISTLTAEEVGNVPVQADPTKITKSQIAGLNLVCERNDVDVKKLIKSINSNYNRLEDVAYSTAIKMLKFVNQIQNGERSLPEAIRRTNNASDS